MTLTDFGDPLRFSSDQFCFVQNLHFVSFSYNWFRAKEMLAIQKARLRRVNAINNATSQYQHVSNDAVSQLAS